MLIADQRMPGMPGTEYLVEARKLVPDAKRVLLTAYADTEAAISAINDVVVVANRHQSLSACEVSSGPLSQRSRGGALSAAGRNDRLEDGNGLISADQALTAHDKRLTGELVTDAEEPLHPPVCGLIVLEVKRPHLIRARGPQRALRGLRVRTGTRRPSSRHRRCTRLR